MSSRAVHFQHVVLTNARQRWGIPRLYLGTYMQFCAVMSFAVTIWLLFVKEDKETEGEDLSIKSVYGTMWNICKLKRTCRALSPRP